ncbi:MAG: hypothetical protein ABFQ82_06615, partial [Thermodesulfobacteriota bacterium]
ATSKAGTEAPRVLFIYYSFSGQTTGLLNNLAAGLRQEGLLVNFIKLRPVTPLRFPVGSLLGTFKMMVTTAFRQRVPIYDLEPRAREEYDMIILAGPTWSYNPSGPILDFIDHFGEKLLKDKTVLPLISCRGYWRMHWLGLKRLLTDCGASVPNRIIFSHPLPEPWRTIGVFLKIAGKAPERSRLLSRYYKRYGHSREQLVEAEAMGTAIARCLKEKGSLAELDLQSTKDSNP